MIKSSLCGPVEHVVLESPLPSDGRDVHYCPLEALGNQISSNYLADIERSSDVDCKEPVEVLLRGFKNWSDSTDAGIVDEEVEREELGYSISSGLVVLQINFNSSDMWTGRLEGFEMRRGSA